MASDAAAAAVAEGNHEQENRPASHGFHLGICFFRCEADFRWGVGVFFGVFFF